MKNKMTMKEKRFSFFADPQNEIQTHPHLAHLLLPQPHIPSQWQNQKRQISSPQ